MTKLPSPRPLTALHLHNTLLIISFTFLSQIGHQTLAMIYAQKTGSISFGFLRNQAFNNLALRSEPKTSRPRPYWSVLLLIIPFSAPSLVNSKSVVRSATALIFEQENHSPETAVLYCGYPRVYLLAHRSFSLRGYG